MNNDFLLLPIASPFSISEFYAMLGIFSPPPPGFKKAQQDSKLGFAMSALSSLQHVLCMHVLAVWKIAVHKVLTYFW